MAPWLSLESDLPPLPEKEENDGENKDQDDPKDDQDSLKNVTKNETGNEEEDFLEVNEENEENPNEQVEVLGEEKKAQEQVDIEYSEFDSFSDIMCNIV